MGGYQRYPGVIRPDLPPRQPIAHELAGAFQRQPGQASLYGGAAAAIVGTPLYRLLLLFNDGNASDYIYDQSWNHYTVTYGSNDPAQHAQTTTQTLFGDSAGFFFRRGDTPGHGGGDANLGWTAGTGMDWNPYPDVLIGGAIWPTYTSGDDDQTILMLRRNVGHWWKLWYDDSGVLHYYSAEGGGTGCILAGSIPLVYGEWNWFFLSMHGGTTTLWIGTNASGIVQLAASSDDTSTYNMGALGTASGSISKDPITSGGQMNCYLDHIFAATGAYIEGTGSMPVPIAEPDPIPLVHFDFEADGISHEGDTGFNPGITNKGTAAFTCLLNGSGGNKLTSAQTISGTTSMLFDGVTAFSYGAAAMDLGATPKAIWKCYYYPVNNPVSFGHDLFCWGDGVSNRFLFGIDPSRVPVLYCVVSGVTKYYIHGVGGPISLNAWSKFELIHDGAGGVEFKVNDVSLGTASDGGVDYSDATFGNMTWGRESWTGDNYCDGYMDEFTLTVLS